MWRHICAHILTEVSITVFIFVFKGKESALFYKTGAPKKKLKIDEKPSSHDGCKINQTVGKWLQTVN